jgi:hypothetical protein
MRLATCTVAGQPGRVPLAYRCHSLSGTVDSKGLFGVKGPPLLTLRAEYRLESKLCWWAPSAKGQCWPTDPRVPIIVHRLG